MSGSTDILVNNGYRPTISSLRPHVINHFQQTTIKKSQSFNRPLKISEIQGLTKNQHTFAKPVNDDSSRATIRNHVQFALPLEDTTPTNLNSSNNSFSVTPTNNNNNNNNNNSSINKISEFKNLNIVNANPSAIRSQHQTGIINNVPLKNITSIRSTSFRNSKNTLPASTVKYEPSKAFQSNYSNNTMTTRSCSLNKNDFSKARNTKSFESLNTVKPGDLKLIDEKLNLDVNTHNIHRLIKMATNWNNTHKSRAELSASSKNAKIADRSLISQTKIRQTQMFLNDENKIDSESSLSRKMAEVTERSIKVTTHHTLDEAFADAMSDKSIRVFNSNRTPVPHRILPISVNRLSNDLAKKSVTSIVDTNEFSSNQGKHGGGTYWSSNSNVTSEIGDNTVGSSAKESSISSYLSKNTKAIKFLHINKGSLNSSFKTNNSRLPIQIQ